MPISIKTEAIRKLDETSGNENLPADTLFKAINVRFTNEGRAETRLGSRKLTNLGSNAKVDNIHTHHPTETMFAKSGTAIYQSKDWEDHAYTIGVTRTASEIDALESVAKNVYATNQTDSFLRIAVSKVAAINSGTGTFSVTTGDGENFSSGTVYIRGTAITGGTISTDDFSGTSGLTASMAVGDIVTQTSTPSGAPKGNAITELEGSTIVSNKAAKPSAVHYSAARTDVHPEFAYDFTANGAGVKDAISGAIALGKVKGGILIGTDRNILFSPGFDVNTGALLWTEVTGEHGVHNFKAFAQGEKVTYVYTNTNRILPIVHDLNGVQIQDPLNKKKALDYPIRSFMNGLDSDQSQSLSFFNPIRSELAVTAYSEGLSYDLVFDESLGVWSRDIGKAFSCKTVLNGKVYAGSDNTDTIYEDNYGRVDDTIPIESFFTTGLLTSKPKMSTFEYSGMIFSGLMSPTGEFTLKIRAKDDEVTYVFTAAYMIDQGYMSAEGGMYVGSGNIGHHQIGGSGSVVEVSPFTIPFDFILEGQNIQIEIEVTDESTTFAWGDFIINPPEADLLLLPST